MCSNYVNSKAAIDLLVSKVVEKICHGQKQFLGSADDVNDDDDVNDSGNDDDVNEMMMIMAMAIVRVKGPLRLETDVSTS